MLYFLFTEEVDRNVKIVKQRQEIDANVKTVKQLLELGSKHCKLLLDFRTQINGLEIGNAKFFLGKLLDTAQFTKCDTVENILDQLLVHKNVDTFNVYYLRKLAEALEKRSLIKLTDKYQEAMDKFFKDTNVLDFQKAVVAKVEPSLPTGMVEITIKISEKLASRRVLKDMENLASQAFEDHQKKFVCLHVTTGSVVVSWHVTISLCGILQQMAQRKETIWRQYGVEEVSVGRLCVFKVSIYSTSSMH